MERKPLLRDTPGFSETIENNSILLDKIMSIFKEIEVENDFESISDDIISSISETLQDAEFNISYGNKISIDDKQGLAQLIWNNIEKDLADQKDFIVQNDNQLSLFVLNEVTEFVNENYTQK